MRVAEMRLEGRQLRLEAQHRGRHQRPPRQVAGIVQQVAGGEIVAAVDHDVEGGHPLQRRGRGQPLGEALDRDLRVQRLQPGGGAVDLELAQRGGVVHHLALQVGQLDDVVVMQPDGADPGGGEIQQQRRAEAAGADHQHPRGQQLFLTLAADLGQQDVARIALDLGVGEAHGRSIAPPPRPEQPG
jgi:hypothetical protein